MKRIQILVCVSLLMSVFNINNVHAQSVKGTKFVNAGIGLGAFGFSGTGGFPLVASAEYGFTDKISGGLVVGYISRKYMSDWKYSYLVIGPKASYHFNEILNVEKENLDVYGGASIYYRHFKVKGPSGDTGDYVKASGGDVSIGFHAGGRYMFSENIGAFAEVGYNIAALQLGLTFKF